MRSLSSSLTLAKSRSNLIPTLRFLSLHCGIENFPFQTMSQASIDIARPKQSIVVIGCGPGGMFFCNAMEHKRRQLDGIDSHLPTITCFERADSPGGVWRSQRTYCDDNEEEKKQTERGQEEHDVPNMYEALWTNGNKEGIEFFDHTYDEHFGHALPVYMPRRALLDYMLKRVTKHCPDLFERYVQFNTTVQSVAWKEELSKFQVITRKRGQYTTQTHFFDKCIWAAGDNGKPKIPPSMQTIFSNFNGRLIHSTDTINFESDVRDKRILIVGGSYSAEDLALMACKVGVEQVYIASRRAENVVTWTSAWPMNKVQILSEETPIGVVENRIQFKKCYWEQGSTYETYGDISSELINIETVILCTGYEKQFDMLELPLRAPFENNREQVVPVPADWKMKPNNLGLDDVTPGKVTFAGSFVSHPEIYRGILIKNPNMMFLRHNHNDYPLLVIDAMAWSFLHFFLGDTPIPSEEEMREANVQQALTEMHFPYTRYYMDPKFKEAWSQLPGAWDDYMTNSEHPYWVSEAAYNRYDLLQMAQTLRDAMYPLDLGDINGLNDKGQKLFEFQRLSYKHRTDLDFKNHEENQWKTFRDTDNADKFESLFTGIKAVPLKKRWIDINEAEDDDIL